MALIDKISKPTFKDMAEFSAALSAGIKEELAAAIDPLKQEIAQLKTQITATTPSTPPASTPTLTPTVTAPPVTPPVTPTVPVTQPPDAVVLAFANPTTLSSGTTITPATPVITGNSSISPTGVIAYPVGSSVTFDVNNIDPNVSFDSWRLNTINGPIASGTTPYTVDVPVDGIVLVAAFKEKLIAGTGGGGGGGGGSSGTTDIGGGEFDPTRLFR